MFPNNCVAQRLFKRLQVIWKAGGPAFFELGASFVKKRRKTGLRCCLRACSASGSARLLLRGFRGLRGGLLRCFCARLGSGGFAHGF